MIGYYVHHHGSGHLARASVVARHCAEPVVALSSLPEPADGHPFAGWVRLAADPRIEQPADPRAGGALHWAPRNSDGYRERMAQLAAWVTAHRPRLVVVDVSAEVAVLVRSLGTAVVTVAVPGRRDDEPHTLAYRLSDLILATWPRQVYEPASLRRHGLRVRYVGALSRFDDRPDPSPPEPRTAAMIAGAGGGGPTEHIARAFGAATGWRCDTFGGAAGWRTDVWERLCAAEVVITHAGMNAVSEVAAARRPAVVVAEDRPFDEQVVTADVLRRAELATVLDGWPDPARWPAILAEARARGGETWKAWNDGHGAERFARHLAEVRR